MTGRLRKSRAQNWEVKFKKREGKERRTAGRGVEGWLPSEGSYGWQGREHRDPC